MKKFKEFIKDIIAEEKKYSWETEGYTKIEFPKKLKEQYKKLQNLKGEEQDAAIAALSDEQKVSLIEYGNEVSTHYGDYFFHFYEMADDYRWYSSERAEYIGDQNRFNRLLQKLNGGVVKEDVNTKPEITQLRRAGNVRWGFLLIPNYNNFIYHTLRHLNNQHYWGKIEKMLVEKLQETPSKLSALIQSKKPVTLAVASAYGDTVALYPNAIIDEVEGDGVAFHLDPKQYRAIKDKFGYNIQTTSLSLQWLKKHPDNKEVKELEHATNTTGFELIKGDKYWYKVYGKEKGQMHQFVVYKAVMLWEDLQEVFDTAIDWYDIQHEAQQKKEQEERKYNSALLKRGKELYDNKEQFNKIYNPIFKKKTGNIAAALADLTDEQLKDVQCYAYYRYVYHYEIYANEHKTAEMADDGRHFRAETEWLENIEEKDHSIAYEASKLLKKKTQEQ